jgi:electron transport complex protein RnfD
MSKESSTDLVVQPAPNITGATSKNRLMLYTFVALLIIDLVTIVMWWPVAAPLGWSLGLTLVICSIIAVGVAVGADALIACVRALISKVAIGSQLNTMSAAVFGLIVTLSYSLGVPVMTMVNVLPLQAPDAFLYVGLISLIGLVLFKKLQGLAGRKYVNPAATAKFIVLLPFLNTVFLAKEHFATFAEGGLSTPLLSGPIGYTVIGNNGFIFDGDVVSGSFVNYLQSCFGLPTATSYADVNWLMVVEKYHGWPGGASSLAVIIVGLGLFILARKYIKWKITLSYLVTVSLMALLLTAFYGGDADVRLLFHLFIGSSIFLAFFMATDPATTPITNTGQLIFGIGLGVLTVLIQTYMNFYGGSLLALIIMNLTVPALDRIGIHKPFGR